MLSMVGKHDRPFALLGDEQCHTANAKRFMDMVYVQRVCQFGRARVEEQVGSELRTTIGHARGAYHPYPTIFGIAKCENISFATLLQQLLMVFTNECAYAIDVRREADRKLSDANRAISAEPISSIT